MSLPFGDPASHVARPALQFPSPPGMTLAPWTPSGSNPEAAPPLDAFDVNAAHFVAEAGLDGADADEEAMMSYSSMGLQPHHPDFPRGPSLEGGPFADYYSAFPPPQSEDLLGKTSIPTHQSRTPTASRPWGHSPTLTPFGRAESLERGKGHAPPSEYGMSPNRVGYAPHLGSVPPPPPSDNRLSFEARLSLSGLPMRPGSGPANCTQSPPASFLGGAKDKPISFTGSAPPLQPASGSPPVASQWARQFSAQSASASATLAENMQVSRGDDYADSAFGRGKQQSKRPIVAAAAPIQQQQLQAGGSVWRPDGSPPMMTSEDSFPNLGGMSGKVALNRLLSLGKQPPRAASLQLSAAERSLAIGGVEASPLSAGSYYSQLKMNNRATASLTRLSKATQIADGEVACKRGSPAPSTEASVPTNAPIGWQKVTRNVAFDDSTLAAVDESSLYLFGSKSGNPSSAVLSSSASGNSHSQSAGSTTFYLWDDHSSSWSSIPIAMQYPSQAPPPPGSGYRSFGYGGQFFLLGGRDRERGLSNYTSLYRYDAKSALWSCLNIAAPQPDWSVRRTKTTCTLVDSRVYLFGGVCHTGAPAVEWHFRNDCWYFDLKALQQQDETAAIANDQQDIATRKSRGGRGDLEWIQIPNNNGDETNAADSHWPSPRAGHAACRWEGRLLVFGGSSLDGAAGSALNDLWVFHPAKDGGGQWKLEVPEGPGSIPMSRYGHTCSAVDASRICVFGGYSLKTDSPLNDLHEYNFAERQWTAVEVEPLPLPRFHHESIVFNGDLWILGGRSTVITSDSGSVSGAKTFQARPVHDIWKISVDKKAESNKNRDALTRQLRRGNLELAAQLAAAEQQLQEQQTSLDRYIQLVSVLSLRLSTLENINEAIREKDRRRERTLRDVRDLLNINSGGSASNAPPPLATHRSGTTRAIGENDTSQVVESAAASTSV